MRKSFLLFIVFYSLAVHSQTIKGKISETNKEVAFATVLIRNEQNPAEILAYQSTDTNGLYTITLKKKCPKVIIEVSSFLNETQQKTIDTPDDAGQTLVVNFELLPKVNDLKEVVINNNPVTKKKDTTTYQIEKFRDGTEKVVEDILKKLPGIKVEENGQVKFNGKNIKKLLLDGDDLFDNQYVIGTRNINIGMLDKVEAIENFNENILLQGLKDNDDVALNLKLKKGKSDLSGNCDVGLGYKDHDNSSVAAVIINDKTKSFGVASHNNIGINNTPFDFKSGIVSLEGIADKTLIAAELINQGRLNRGANYKLDRINDNFFSSGNLLFKLSPKATIKANLNYYHDALSNRITEETTTTLDSVNFSFLETENIHQKPKAFNANIQLINNTQSDFNWEYLGKLNHQATDYYSDSANNALLQNNQVTTRSFYTKHNLNFTKRINQNSALVFYGLYAKSRSPQQYSLQPGIAAFGSDGTLILRSDQFAGFGKETFNTKADLLKKAGAFRLSFRLGFNSTRNTFSSLLNTTHSSGTVQSELGYQNDLIYQIRYPFVDTGVSFTFKKFNFRVNLASQYFNLHLTDHIRNQRSERNKLVANPSARIIFKANVKNSFTASYALNQINPDERNTYAGIVQTGYRNFSSNDTNLEFLRQQNCMLSYFYNDLFHLTKLSVNINYNVNANNYFTSAVITSNISSTSTFLLDEKSKNYSVNLEYEKYIRLLKLTITISPNFSASFDKNIINGSELRNITNNYLTLDLVMRKKLAEVVHLENKFTYTNSTFRSNEVSNSLSSIKNTSKLKANFTERLKFIPILNFLANNLRINENYWFLDAELTYTSKNKKIDYSLIANNITNIRAIQSTSVSDYSRVSISQSLMQRFILASVSFRF